MGMGGRPGRPRPARDAHQPLLVRRNYLLRPRDIAFPDEVMRSRVWPTLGLGYYVSQPFDPMAVSSHTLSSSSHLYPSSLPSLSGGYTCHYFGYCLNQPFNPIILFYILGLTGFRVCPYLVTLSLFGHASDACPY